MKLQTYPFFFSVPHPLHRWRCTSTETKNKPVISPQLISTLNAYQILYHSCWLEAIVFGLTLGRSCLNHPNSTPVNKRGLVFSFLSSPWQLLQYPEVSQTWHKEGCGQPHWTPLSLICMSHATLHTHWNIWGYPPPFLWFPNPSIHFTHTNDLNCRYYRIRTKNGGRRVTGSNTLCGG